MKRLYIQVESTLSTPQWYPTTEETKQFDFLKVVRHTIRDFDTKFSQEEKDKAMKILNVQHINIRGNKDADIFIIFVSEIEMFDKLPD